VVAFDINPLQLAHVEQKARAVEARALGMLNVEDARADGLNQRGEFESLFRILHGFLRELVLSEEELEQYFSPGTSAGVRSSLVGRWVGSRYWPAAFAVTFADAFLHAMFGPAATQHAVPGSYPGYFQRAFERGLTHPEGAMNPFLQHVLLGHYRAADAPVYIHAGRLLSVELVEGALPQVPALERFDVISLSNIFDWSDDALVGEWARLLAEKVRPGCLVVMRQLNNQRSLRPFFSQAFHFEDGLGQALQAQERSLFYERILVARRRDA
jgi:S-adenosylmethionine-diacylglycerol 3-amino-3-carboxypropyl transferase